MLTKDQIAAIINKHTTSFPVAVGKIAEDLGLTVISTADLPKGMSGSISKEPEGYVVYVNAHQPLRRQRFTIAHEIGHFVEHKKYLDKADEILNPSKKIMLKRGNQSPIALAGAEERKREMDADDFAANLLMPETTFRDVWAKAQCLRDVADFFGVSEMAANVRAALLGLGYFDEINGTTN